jgi:hypothetical protein
LVTTFRARSGGSKEVKADPSGERCREPSENRESTEARRKNSMQRFRVLSFSLAIGFLIGGAGCKSGDRGVVESKETGAATATIADQTHPYMITSDANVRTGPGTQYSIVTTVSKGTRVNVAIQEGDWLKVASRFGRPPGYIHENLARPIDVTVSGGFSNPPAPYLTIRDTSVRQGPGMGYQEVAKIPRNTRVNVVGSEGDWLKVQSKWGNPPGYILKKDADITASG